MLAARVVNMSNASPASSSSYCGRRPVRALNAPIFSSAMAHVTMACRFARIRAWVSSIGSAARHAGEDRQGSDGQHYDSNVVVHLKTLKGQIYLETEGVYSNMERRCYLMHSVLTTKVESLILRSCLFSGILRLCFFF